jgi:superfamily II DNA or RNA helicase
MWLPGPDLLEAIQFREDLMSDTPKQTRKIPPLATYQTRTCEGTLGAARRGEDTLIEAPTGSGKTPMIARIGARSSQQGHKTLVLTHRKTLFSQMVGRASGETEKARAGEMLWWGGLKPGTIADSSLGGMDQESGLVVAMVETAAARLDQLAKYDRIIIDEVQHVSEDSAERESMGSYARVLEAQPEATLIGLTATTFRGDGDKLHPRLEKAHREVVSIEEARAEGRVVPAKTVIGKAPTESGRTARDLVVLEAQGKLGRSASAVLKDERGPAFYDHVVEDWERIASQKKTIVFVDSIDEVEEVTEKFNVRYGAGSAVNVHGRNSGRVNDDAIMSYSSMEGAGVLVACQMIGEGFDVPGTDCVMSTNASLSRLEMNQYVGRCVRSANGKEYGLFVDYGTASHRHGLIEHQHQLQNVDALAASETKIGAARVLGRMAPEKEGSWRAASGADRSFFLQSVGSKFAVFSIDHKAEKEIGRKKTKSSGSMSRLRRFDHPEHGTSLLSITQVGTLLADQAKSEAGYLARQGGIDSDNYRKNCRNELDSWSSMFKIIEQTDSLQRKASSAEVARGEAITAALNQPDQERVRSRLVRKSLEGAKSGMDMVRESMSLSGAVLAHCADRDDMPLGLKSEARAVLESLDGEDIKTLTPGKIRREAMATSAVMGHMAKAATDRNLSAVISDVADPLSKGIRTLTREISVAARKKKSAAIK